MNSDSAYQQLKAERDELDEECNQLHEKNGDLNLDLQKLQDELQQARETLNEADRNLAQAVARNCAVDDEVKKLREELQQAGEVKHQLELDRVMLAERIAELENQSQPSTSETALPDLYEIRDRTLKGWRLAKRAESKERLYEFANIFIEEIAKADASYDFIDRLLSDLEQERRSSAATSEAMREWNQRYESAVKKAKYRGVVIE